MALSLVLLGLVMIAVLGASQERASARPVFPKGEGRCQGCAYDLAGLPEAAACPECGRNDPGAPDHVTVRRVLSPRVLARVGLVVVCSILARLSLLGLVWLAHGWSYTLQLRRYDPETIARAIRVRGFDLDWEAAIVPLLLAECAATVCCLMGAEARVGRLVAVLIAGGWVGSVVWLFAQTYVVYG